MKPVFCFSLDIELAVGIENIKSNRKFDEKKEIIAIQNFFELTAKYEIPTTIAFCSHLFLDECSCHKNNQSVFAPELVRQAVKEGHEVACHSFSHAHFQKISEKSAREELEQSVKAAKRLNVTFDTFIYPRNEIAYKHLLPNFGFKFVTTNIVSQSFFNPKFISPKNSLDLIEVPRTYYFSQSNLKQSIKLKSFLLHSKFRKKFFHLWCHPFNLIRQNEINLLENTFKFVKENGFETKKINELSCD